MWRRACTIPHAPPHAHARASLLARAGICVTSLDASLLERAVLATPGSVRETDTAIALVKRIKWV